MILRRSQRQLRLEPSQVHRLAKHQPRRLLLTRRTMRLRQARQVLKNPAAIRKIVAMETVMHVQVVAVIVVAVATATSHVQAPMAQVKMAMMRFLTTKNLARLTMPLQPKKMAKQALLVAVAAVAAAMARMLKRVQLV
jgi:hypothetical protein